MSLVLKSDPVGIDIMIERLQKKMFPLLLKKWGLVDGKYNCTPRCYRNQKETGYIAELYVGKNDYREVYYDDKVSATSFFGIGQEEKITDKNATVADVHLIFSVNLKEIKPGNERNDEAARLDVQSILDTWGQTMGFLLQGTITGIDKILYEYPGSRKEMGLKYNDMHPKLWFRFDMKLYYTPTHIKC